MVMTGERGNGNFFEIILEGRRGVWNIFFLGKSGGGIQPRAGDGTDDSL